MSTSGTLEVADPIDLVAGAEAPAPDVAAVHRLQLVERDVLDLLQVAAILGPSFDVRALALVSDQSPAQLWPVLRTAVEAGLIVDAGDELAFRHALLHEALLADVPAGMRAALHLDAGRRLRAAGAAPRRVAPHLLEGATHGDLEAVATLRAAARDAAPEDPDAAVTLLRHALTLTRPIDAERDTLLPDLAAALMWAGKPAEGEQVLREMITRGCDAALEARVRLDLSQACMHQGLVEESVGHADRVVATVPDGSPEYVRGLAWGAMGRLFQGDLAGALRSARDAEAPARQAGDHLALGVALATRGLVAGDPRRPRSGRLLPGPTRRGLADYYLPDERAGGGDGAARLSAPGSSWWGGGAEALELAGHVERAEFVPLYAKAVRPDGGFLGRWFRLPEEAAFAKGDALRAAAEIADPDERWMAKHDIRRTGVRASVAAWDCTFSPAKSVSLLWAAADQRIQQQVWAGHLAAVDAGLAYLEEHAAYVRAGRNGVRVLCASPNAETSVQPSDARWNITLTWRPPSAARANLRGGTSSTSRKPSIPSVGTISRSGWP